MEQSNTPGAGTPPAAVEIVRYTLLSLSLAVASLLLLPFYGLALIVLPMPALLATMKHGARAGIIVAVAAAIPVALVAGLGLGGAVGAMTLCLGVGQAMLTRRGVRASRLLTLCIATFVLVAAGAVAAAFAARVVSFGELMQMSTMFQRELARYAGQATKETAKAIKDAGQLSVYLMPSELVVLCLMTGMANFLASQALLRMRGLPNASLRRFQEWQVPWYLAWPFLIGLACAVGYRYLAPAQRQPAFYIGLNLLVIFGALYMVQGLSVVLSLFDRFKLKPPVRAFLLVFAVTMQFFLQALTWLGLFDTWFNYRKLKTEE